MLRNRKDVLSHTDLYYPEVVAGPLSAFRKVREAGWPLTDLDAAVAVVEPTKMRMVG
jgi:hypothetical protein